MLSRAAMIRLSFPVLIESMAREMGLTQAQKAMLLIAWFPCVSLSPDAIQRYRCDLSSVRPLVVFTHYMPSQRVSVLWNPVRLANSDEGPKADPRTFDGWHQCFSRTFACCRTPRRVVCCKRGHHGSVHFDMRRVSGATGSWENCYAPELVTDGWLAGAFVSSAHFSTFRGQFWSDDIPIARHQVWLVNG